MEQIRKAFDSIASQYDTQRQWVIPEFGEFYGAAVWAADSGNARPEILDLGAGTGLLAALLIARYPTSPVTLMDFSEQMLAVAKKRFAGNEQIQYLSGDYGSADIGGQYDLICSALSIHHFDGPGKRRVYRKVFDSLSPGGLFVNADQVHAETPRLQERYLEYWDTFLEGGPLDRNMQDEIKKRRDTLDRMEKLSVQLACLREIGFEGVDVVYKNRNFAVFIGMKGTR
jgi:tRNA (cmo5U34)-methyltransferase